jgi:hypothetical protein
MHAKIFFGTVWKCLRFRPYTLVTIVYLLSMLSVYFFVNNFLLYMKVGEWSGVQSRAGAAHGALLRSFAVCSLLILLSLAEQYVLRDPEQFNYVVLAAQGGQVVSFFLWTFISKKIGKKPTYWIGAVIWYAYVCACV